MYITSSEVLYILRKYAIKTETYDGELNLKKAEIEIKITKDDEDYDKVLDWLNRSRVVI